MLQQSIGILTALVFVLGLVAVAVWAAKRFGAVSVNPRARVIVEVVQRISLGPKTGLAVVRVGEKVVALSMGPDGLRPLFELDETDRQRVIATSHSMTAFLPSAEAGRTVARLLPGRLGRLFQRGTPGVPASFAETMKATLEAVAEPVPAASATATGADRAFHGMLNIAMSGATRLAVLALMLGSVVTSASTGAQVVPVVPPPVVTPTPVVVPQLPLVQPVVQPPAAPQPAVQPLLPPVSTPTLQPPAAPPAPVVSVPPAFVVPRGQTRPARIATPRPALIQPARPTPAQPPAGPAPQTAGQRATADSLLRAAAAAILPGSASRSPNRTNAAAPAPIAGGEDALARMIPQMDLKMGDEKDGGLRLSGTIGIVVMMGLLSLLPTLVLMMTGFTRILIVLHFLKQAMGTQSAPPAQLLGAMALLLTGFVMAPTLTEMNRSAVQPWMEGRMTQVDMLKEGVKPLRVFMLKQTREADMKTFIELSHLPRPNTVNDVPLHVLTSAFVASELRRAFQIGFMIYLPFIIIDAVVASVLMSMGMFMLPPAMISMPFKLLLFVLVDGWGLIIQELVKSFK